MRTGTKIGLGIGLLAAVGLGGAGMLWRGGDPGLEVQTRLVESKDLVAYVLANGKVQPRNKVDVSANIAGQIVNLAVREGDHVEKGAFLLQIDQAQYEANAQAGEANLQSLLHDRDVARANREQARYDREKARSAFDDELIPETEYQRARSSEEAAEATYQAALQRVEQARAALEGARDSLDKTTIRAPISGVVTALPVHEGEVAVIGTMNNPGTILLTVSDLSEIDADLAVDETDVPRLAVGQHARLRVEAYPDVSFEGQVREIGSSPIRPGSQAAERTGSIATEAIDFEVKVSVLEPPAGIRPGFSVTADIETGRAEGVPAVPIQALVSREKPGAAPEGGGRAEPAIQEGVYVREGGTVRFAEVRTGLTGELDVQVLDGVLVGQEIVIGPFRALRELKDGDAVHVAGGDDAASEE